MFRSARIKLTARYLLIIMTVSFLFSLAIYSGVNSELKRIERFQNIRSQQRDDIIVQPAISVIQPNGRGQQIQRILIPPQDDFDPEIVDHARTRIILILLLINFSILLFSGLAGYILAGQTLRPIQEMVDEQNRFVTDSSHELRTPLTALRSEIEVNLRDKKLTLAAAKELLHSNLEEVKNLQQLSDSLIRLTQYQGEQNHQEFLPVSLPVIIDESVKKIRAIAKAKKITIVQEVPEALIEADSAMLSELFVILFDNAIKYSPEKTTITVKAKQTDHQVKITVADQGVGIDGKDIPLLFGRFYRADKSRTQSETQGYGLGLSIAKEIVEKHQGQISVSSVVGKGSTFTIQLPLRHSSPLL